MNEPEYGAGPLQPLVNALNDNGYDLDSFDVTVEQTKTVGTGGRVDHGKTTLTVAIIDLDGEVSNFLSDQAVRKASIMIGIFQIVTLIVATIGFCFMILNFVRFWRNRALAVAINDGALSWHPAVKETPEFQAMRRSWWLFVSWTIGTVIMCNGLLPYARRLLT